MPPTLDNETVIPKTSTDYWLGRGFMNSVRLTYQHWILKSRSGFDLHPDIVRDSGLADATEESPNKPLQILDLATGNGIWATEVAEQFGSSVKVTALDISDAMFPLKPIRPDNVEYGVFDLF